MGDQAPNFKLQATDGKTYQLSDFKGKKAVVVAWFPAAFTRGCTIECKSLAENGDKIKIGPNILKYLSGLDVESQYHEEIYRMTIIDGLTGAHVKRYFLECLEKEMNRARRHRRPLCLVMFDIDHFKKVNDQYGHLAGDHVLKEVARIVSGRVRRDEPAEHASQNVDRLCRRQRAALQARPQGLAVEELHDEVGRVVVAVPTRPLDLDGVRCGERLRGFGLAEEARGDDRLRTLRGRGPERRESLDVSVTTSHSMREVCRIRHAWPTRPSPPSEDSPHGRRSSSLAPHRRGRAESGHGRFRPDRNGEGQGHR